MTSSFVARARERLREPSPILVRELRSLFRAPLFVRFLSFATGGVALIVLTIASFSLMEHTAPSELGRVLFDTFFMLVIAVSVVVTPLHAATSITTERESQTYETLVLSGMDPARIAVGKLTSTLAAIGLVLVAFSPVVGVSFLFGGVSPLEVLLAYLLVAVFVTPGAALGVAISSRFETTRTAIIMTISTSVVLVPFATIFLGMLVGAGMPLAHVYEGPLDVVRYVADHIDDPSLVALGIVVPVALSALTTAFFACTAIAALRPPAEDRITPFKTWSLVCIATVFVWLLVLAAELTGTDVFYIAVTAQACISAVLVLVLIDDSPLPIRTTCGASSRGYARIGSVFGPGLAGTTRFAALLLFVAPVGFIGAAVVGSVVGRGASVPDAAGDAGIVSLAVLVIAVFALALGAATRSVVANGNLVRVLVVLAFVALTIAPILIGLAISPDALDTVSGRVAPAFLVTPVGPLLAALDHTKPFLPEPGLGSFVSSTALYVCLTVGLFAALARSLRRIAARAEARRAELVGVIAARRAARADGPEGDGA